MNLTREKGTIVVFRIQLSAPSEAFIVAQAAAIHLLRPTERLENVFTRLLEGR